MDARVEGLNSQLQSQERELAELREIAKSEAGQFKAIIGEKDRLLTEAAKQRRDLTDSEDRLRTEIESLKDACRKERQSAAEAVTKLNNGADV